MINFWKKLLYLSKKSNASENLITFQSLCLAKFYFLFDQKFMQLLSPYIWYI